MSQFKPLPVGAPNAGTGFQRPHQNLPEHVSLDSPAIDVVTDQLQVGAETVTANASVDDAEEKMIASGVRLLFVTSPLNQAAGIITSKDLSGERIMHCINHKQTLRAELIVRDTMTSQHKIDVLEMGDVATVGDIVITLRRMGRQHVLVADRDPDGRQTIRGLLSTSQIGRQLGETIDTAAVAGNFAGLARAG